MIQTDPL